LQCRPKQAERWAWLFLTLFQPTTVDHAMNICNGSDRPYVVWNKGMEKMPVLVPPPELVASFDSLVRPMLSAITGFYFLQRNLQRTRDLLLPRLISGKLPVEDLAIAFPLKWSPIVRQRIG
jgi:type I restriction enzyme S subunit